MRRSFLALGFILAACASPPLAVTSSTLISADAATTLAVGERLTELRSAQGGGDGMDPLVTVTLRHADGRTLAFQEANHAPNDLRAQAAGGPLAQIMGLQQGDEVTTLYHAADGERSQRAGAPFLCGPQGPAAIGKYEGADGVIQIVGLREGIQFESRPDGQVEAIPYSPDHVCARLRFRRG
jgi:L-alanine-DL-glutamate epimerase-like enolase superfamily enzyme